jgi:PcfJ-like protein
MTEWRVAASREARRLRVEERRERLRAQDARRHAAEVREAALRAALRRQPKPLVDAIERVIQDETNARRPSRTLRELLVLVARRAPRLLQEGGLEALKLVAAASWARPVDTWKPSGKSRDRLFRSLAAHLLAHYPMPPFLWSAFFAGEDAPALARVVIHVAAGGSLFAAVKSGLLPVPLTRAMCHELLTRGGGARFLDAVRRVQVKAAGGDGRLFRTWVATQAGRQLHSPADEEFWQTVIAWLSANPMLPQAEVGPIVDYIADRRAEAPGFSIKGRSVLALLRAVRDWHGQLARQKATSGRTFQPSGLEPIDIDWSRVRANGNRLTERWHFREILDERTLADEGRAMSHCVLSYARQIESRQCAIWTATLEDDTGHWRRLTIEVRPFQRLVVQARGRFNRRPEPRDLMALNEWASRNRLQVVLGF